jgi:FlaA1/EpsC-like NDP-sugar epimerase
VLVQFASENSIRSLLRYRQPVALCSYGIIAAIAYFAAFQLRFEFRLTHQTLLLFATTAPILVLLRIASDWAFRLSSGHWRFVGPQDVTRLGLATTLGSICFFVVTWLVPGAEKVPRSIIVIEWVVSTYLTAALWLGYRLTREQLRHYRAGTAASHKRVLIVGAGDAGSLLAREMMRAPTGFRPVGFVDDDSAKHGTMLYGLNVFGGTSALAKVCLGESVDEAVIAIPSATPHELRRIVECCEAAKVRFKVLPGIADVLGGNVRVSQLRDLRIEDLLGREPVRLELPELYDDLRGRCVLITGAAGSIGSELARQVALHDPGVLILLDQAETPLFYLERELRELHPDLQTIFVVADIVDGPAISRLFHDYAPSRVYHAAAYKHVPMMQINPRQAIRNNVLGTYLVAEAAGRSEAEKFVLVSTDKAVKPTSVMGATKRLAEMSIQELQRRYEGTCFAAVRFGNVLGSNGSVIPIFKEQIESGRPLTVTHPEVTRYFMTIPEAAHLILQASLLSDIRGRIAMLEMGDPIRIVDLARNLLRLSGSTYEHGKDVVFTGLRWGEKLHEELVAPDEVTRSTRISKVKLVQPSHVSLASVRKLVDEWELAFAEGRDAAVISSLTSLFPSLHYRSTPGTPESTAVLVGEPMVQATVNA